MRQRFKFKEGQYFRANVCGDRPIGKIIKIERTIYANKKSWLVYFKWERENKYRWLPYTNMQEAYSVSGPIEKVSKLEGLITVGE
jgi:hypothetical protein